MFFFKSGKLACSANLIEPGQNDMLIYYSARISRLHFLVMGLSDACILHVCEYLLLGRAHWLTAPGIVRLLVITCSS